MKEKRPTAGIVLAAGMSTRMGWEKLLMEMGGQTILSRVVKAALASELAEVILVLGHESKKTRASLGPLVLDQRLSTVFNKNYRKGMAGSLRAGLKKAQGLPSVMFLLGDQPFLDAAVINLLLHRFWESDRDICVPAQGGKRGNPVIFSARFYDEILNIRGDKGARDMIRNHPEDVFTVEIDAPYCFLDIDSPADAQGFLSLITSR